MDNAQQAGKRSTNLDWVQKKELCQGRAQHNANVYEDWALDRVFILFGANKLAARFTGTMKDYPISQTPNSFNLDSVKKRGEEMSRMEN